MAWDTIRTYSTIVQFSLSGIRRVDWERIHDYVDVSGPIAQLVRAADS